MSDAATLAVEAGIAILTLDRPQRMNAVNSGMHDALRRTLDEVEHDPSVRALIVTGRGDAFCAGQDLSERKEMLEEKGEVDLAASLQENYSPLMRRLAALPVPVIAAVNGIAAGAGASLALNCDIVLAAQSARFQFAFVRVALGPDGGASYWLPRLVGQARALGLALTGQPLDAATAADWGLIWKCLPDDRLMADAKTLAGQFSAGPRAALASIKAQLRVAHSKSFEECLEAERVAQGGLGHHPDYSEAVLAFADKRQPAFAK